MRVIRRRWWLIAIALGLICLFGVPLVFSLLPRPTVQNTTDLPSVEVVAAAPAAPVLTANSDRQVIYHIDPTQSEARYSVQELILNTMQGRTVVGSSQAITGDLLIDFETPAASRLGEIVIGVDSLTSDSDLRDQRLRGDYLESERYPEARFIGERLIGLPETVEIGDAVTVQVEGYLTVKATTARVTWEVALTLEADRLTGTATTDIQMSTFQVGPINLIGWLQTEDVMRLSFDFVATPDRPVEIAQRPETVTTPEAVERTPSTNALIDFEREVRPILETKCVGCHTTGQIGYTVFPMVTVSDVINFADDIAQVVESGYMPPWPPDDDMPALQHDRSLTDAEMATLIAWAAEEIPVTDASDDTLAVVDTNTVQLREDLMLPMPVEYLSPEGVTDDYRCFLLDPQLESQRYITGSEVIPGNVSVVHHVLVFPVPAEARAAAEAKSNKDGRPGWECFGGTGLTDVETNTAIAPGWVPGSGANQFPDGTGILLQPGDLLVFQAHYNLEAGAQPDRSTLILELSDPGTEMIALQGIGLVAPVELPCPIHYRDTEPCRRQYAVASAETRDPMAGWLADGFLVLCDRTLEDYVDQDPARIVSTCDSTAPISGQAIQVSGHMHKLGTSTRIELNPDTPTAQLLLDLPYWDFDWQENYNFVEPIRVEAGDTLRLTCTWDNTRGIRTDDAQVRSVPGWASDIAPAFGVSPVLAHDELNTNPFHYVTWGEGTRDEMCLGAVIVIPDPEYYGVTLIDGGDSDETAIMASIVWMRLMRQPALIGGGVLVVVLLVGGGVALYRRTRAVPGETTPKKA